jgi:tRNA-specific 2-thiouridylase
VATGHYARLRREIQNPKSKILNYKYKLFRAKDKNKDQSYFLWRLNQKQLSHILFPIGDLKKKEVRELAKKFKLPVLKEESQEICFVSKTVNDFLNRYFKKKPGKIINTRGEIIGCHQGLWFYTIGQRKGIGLAGGPYYVLDKDLKNNFLIVTKREKDLYKKELICRNVNWISPKLPKFPLKVKAKIRSRSPLASAVLKPAARNKIRVIFQKKQKAITPGQSAVFYQAEELLGGGIIV